MLLASFCFSAPNGTAGVIQWDSGGGWEKFYPITPMKHHKNVRDGLQNTTLTHAMVQGSDGQCHIPLPCAQCTQLPAGDPPRPLLSYQDMIHQEAMARMNILMMPVHMHLARSVCIEPSTPDPPIGDKGQVTLQGAGAVDGCLLTGTGSGFTAENSTHRTADPDLYHRIHFVTSGLPLLLSKSAARGA